MPVNNYKVKKVLALAILLPIFVANSSYTQADESWFDFKFHHYTNMHSEVAQGVSSPNDESLEFSQFDATWTYPWEVRNININFGVTLRHLSGTHYSGDKVSSRYFQELLPLVHASALFALPLKGLSAGIEGSHLDLDNNQMFDYRAKVSYEWRKGFGLHGGWQHQQFSIGNSVDAGYEKNGPFIDFYLNF